MTLVEEARRLGPEFAASVDEGEELRRLPDRTWKALHGTGVLRALQPARFGGGERPLGEFMAAVAEISRWNPAAGWVAGVIGVHPWQLALFPDEAQQEMWADDPSRMHSSSYNPTGKAERVEGGYRVSGRWSFSSGCDHCEGVNLGAIVGGGAPDGLPEYRSFLLHSGQYEIDDNWFVAGLKGTGSKDIVVADAFVPEHRSQSHLDYAVSAPLPGQEVNPGVLYRLPWSVVFNVALAASVLGAARGFVDTWVEECRDRRIPPGVRLADDALTQQRLAHATWDLDAAFRAMEAVTAEITERAEVGDAPSMEDRGRMRWTLNRGCERVGDAVVELFRAASGRSIFLDHPLQRRFQDVQGALGHAFLVPDPLARIAGGTLLGATNLEPVL